MYLPHFSGTCPNALHRYLATHCEPARGSANSAGSAPLVEPFLGQSTLVVMTRGSGYPP